MRRLGGHRSFLAQKRGCRDSLAVNNQSVQCRWCVPGTTSEVKLLDPDGKPQLNTVTKDVPCTTTKLIGPNPDGEPFEEDWYYRSILGKLNFLEKLSRGEIAYALHQCARFASNPKASHGKAIKHVDRYLLKMRNKVLLIRPKQQESFECWVDADLSGNWDKKIAASDPNTAKPRSSFVIKYAGVQLAFM